jgi:hypothetical protein
MEVLDMQLLITCHGYATELRTKDAHRVVGNVLRLVDLASRSGVDRDSMRVEIQSLTTSRMATVKVSPRNHGATADRVKVAFLYLSLTREPLPATCDGKESWKMHGKSI